MISLRSLICEETSIAAQQAHAKGWVSGGWGTWKDGTGKTVAKTIMGKLTPINQIKDYEEEEDIEDFSQTIRNKYNPKNFELYLNPGTGDVHLSSIILNKDQQGQGIGTKIMDDLIDYVDAHGRRLTLTPMEKNKDHGTTSSNRLKKFYKRFGFVPNAGRYKDYRISDTMIRYPKSQQFGEDIKAGTGDGAEAGRTRDTWRIDPEDSSVVRYGARNTFGKVRYFDNEESARKFAAGQTKSRLGGYQKKLRKQRPTPPERKQTYRFRND